MISLNNTNVQVFMLVLNVLLQSVESTESLVQNDIR